MTASTISEASICNMALGRIGSTQTITSFGDGSNEANQCALWYPQDRDAMLSDYPFPWSTGYQQLAQVAGPEINGQIANAEWSRTYRYPSDCLKLRRVVATDLQASTSIPQTTGVMALYPSINRSWRRAAGDPSPISFSEGQDATGRLIMTDAYGDGAGLTAVYTRKVEDPTQMAADFADALAWRVAMDLAMSLGFSDGKRQWCAREYEQWVRRARASAQNAGQSDIPLISYQSETVRARWGRR